ncbi:MAG: NAD+ diphosphatase [Psychromonas sp.]|jgi:NAD+ diphosphatase|uniref:NUDIX hydrolase n=1 Tax=Psychromonas sp. TaxID=1884585 RepID=UPI0039E43E82
MFYCPQCGLKSLETISSKKLFCGQCQFTFFQNTAAAVMVAICCQDELLVATRGRNPGIGMWDLPGGFVDPDESLENAVVRELYEELDITVTAAKYIFSNSNTYLYKDVEYKTCDAFFVVELDEKPTVQAQDDVAAVEWVKLADVDITRFAFESAKKAVLKLREK